MNPDKRTRHIFNFSLALVIVLAFLFGFQSAGLLKLLADRKAVPAWVTDAANGLSYNLHASARGFTDSEMAVFHDVITMVSEEYLHKEDVTHEDILFGASSGAVNALGDPYSRFVQPPDQQVLTEEIEGEYAGIGVRIFDQTGVLPYYAMDCEISNGIDPEDASFLRETRGVIIVQVFETGPAFTAGLEANDVIICVEENNLRGGTSQDAANLIKGPVGTEIEISIWRPALQQELSMMVERQTVLVPTVGATEMLSDNIGYVRLDEFNNQSSREVTEAFNSLLMEGMEGLIFDLRNNTGGVMTAAVEISDLFIADGTLVIYEDNEGGRIVFTSQDHGDAIGIPVIVLVNGSSASSSEIVAGAIKDSRTGILVGTNTFGKGVVQNVYPLRDGSGLVLTTGRYLTPGENEITREGIEPDILSDLDPERLRAIDPQVEVYLNRMDELVAEVVTLREQIYTYQQENDFQQAHAIELMDDWLETGLAPQSEETEEDPDGSEDNAEDRIF